MIQKTALAELEKHKTSVFVLDHVRSVCARVPIACLSSISPGMTRMGFGMTRRRPAVLFRLSFLRVLETHRESGSRDKEGKTWSESIEGRLVLLAGPYQVAGV